MTDRAKDKQLVKRRDAEGNLHVAPSWESLIDRQIREAMEEGKFEDLPHQGRPLPLDENPYAGDMALAFSMLKNAGVAPPWIEADKEVRDLLAQRDQILERARTGRAPSALARSRARHHLRSVVNDVNRAIARVNAEAPASSLHRLPLDVEDELRRFDEACRR